MSDFTYMAEFDIRCYPTISVEANLRSRLCRSQNRVMSKGLPV